MKTAEFDDSLMDDDSGRGFTLPRAPASRGGHDNHDEEHEGPPHEEGEPWLMSFADLILNLLLFFIVLYSMSTLDEKKFQELAQQINGEEVPQTMIAKSESAEENGEILQEIQTLMQKVNQEVASDAQKKQAAEVQSKLGEMFRTAPGKDKENDLFEVILSGESFFQKGSGKLTPKTRTALRKFAEKLKPIQGGVGLYIEGHASPDELLKGSTPGSEWMIANERATNVLLELQSQGLRVKDVSTAGFGAKIDLSENSAAVRKSAVTKGLESAPKTNVMERARVHLRVVREVKTP